MLKTVLIDLSGTLHVADEVIPGAVEALKRFVCNEITIKKCLHSDTFSKTLHLF